MRDELFRMTPVGDAIRIWSAISLATVLYVVLILTAPLVVFSLGYLNAMMFFMLGLTLIAMYRCSPEELKKWAVFQSKPRSRWRRFVLMSYGQRVFGGRTGFGTIILFISIGMFSALAIIPVAMDESVTLTTLFAYLLSIFGVLTAWFFLHTSFALQYASLYYRPGVAGGFEFPGGDGTPGVVDFAYFSFTVGTSFAASDVSVTSSRIRKTVLVHSILSFFYNTAILALIINIVLSAL